MSFRYVYAALAVVPILIYPVATKEVLVPQDYCNVDIAEIQSFGKSTGSPWCAMRVKDGVFINGVKTWSGPLEGWSLVPLGLTTGLEVSYTDGSTAMFGEQTGPWYDEISWDPAKVSVDWLTASDIALTGEFVDVDPDTWMNRLQIMLTDGQYLCSGGNREVESNSGCEKDKPKDPRHWLGGSLLGFSGATGSGGIEAITVYFLKSDAENTEIHDVVLSPTIEELNKRPPEERGLTQKTLMIGHCLNDLEAGNVTFSLSKDTQFSRTQKVSNTIEDAWHVGTSVSFEYSWGAPDEVFNKKVIVGMDFFWEHTKSHTEETTEGSSTTVKWGESVPVLPGKAVRVAGYALEGKMDVTWKGKMTLTLKTGEKVTFPTGGTLKDTLYSNSYSLIEDEDPEMARQAVLEGDGDMVDQNGKPLPPPARSKRKTRRNFVA